MQSKYSFKQQFTKNFPGQNLPREKLIQNGPDSLSNSELISIIFVTGNRQENVLELSSRVIKEYGSRCITEIKDVSKVSQILDLGPAKSAQLVAIFELGRRFFKEQSERMPVIRGPEDVFNLLKDMSKLKKEELRTLYLNSRQVVIREELISLGNENMNIVGPKEIINPAIELMCKGLIIVHNHPSGLAEASEEDIDFTKRIKEACEIMQIQLLDHVIIGNQTYFSFANDGLLDSRSREGGNL